VLANGMRLGQREFRRLDPQYADGQTIERIGGNSSTTSPARFEYGAGTMV